MTHPIGRLAHRRGGFPFFLAAGLTAAALATALGVGNHADAQELVGGKVKTKFDGSTLIVQGSSGNDAITLRLKAGDPNKLVVEVPSNPASTQEFNRNSFDAVLVQGGAGDDTLQGGAGADTLTGNEDADRFQFVNTTDGHVVATNTTVTTGNYDTVTDFESGIDTIQITAANFGFSGGTTFTDDVNFSVIDGAYDGTFDNSSVAPNSEWAAGRASLIFDSVNSRLIYDANGAGAGYTILAQVQGGSVQASDVTTN